MGFLFWLLIGYIAYRILKGYAKERRVERTAGTYRETAGDETYRDPVCGVYVAEDDAVIGRLGNERIHFCSMACLDKYREQIADK